MSQADQELTQWRYRRHDEETWKPCHLPAAWEDLGRPLDDSGPYLFATEVVTVGEPTSIVFDAVAYHCTVRWDGVDVATHEGMWTPFEVFVGTPATGTHQLEVAVEKVASLTGGPDAPAVAGSFPTREVPSGFLPYVSGHLPGGIWQQVRLRQGLSALTSLQVRVQAQSVLARGEGPGDLGWRLCGLDGQVLASGECTSGQWFEIDKPAGAEVWSGSAPHLYQLELTSDGTPVQLRTVGFRAIAADGHRLLLNGDPFYPRFALSWGWYPDQLAPCPGPEHVKADLTTLAELGFNGVKLCLWVPPEHYFDIADRLGMALWVELPMWIPLVDPDFEERMRSQALAIAELAARHPSVVLYSLGCELNHTIRLEFLEELFASVSQIVQPALVCENSGAGEAYGGWDRDFAGFRDHHPYCEPWDLGGMLDHWSPRWRSPKPWLFGETLDQDTFRIPPSSSAPWWWSADQRVNPQGARWQYDLPWFDERLREAGLSEHYDELARRSVARDLFMRKRGIEKMRQRPETSGYVITAERDTPISTSGILDDDGKPKFDAARWRAFNADTVITLDVGRRSRWADGARPSHVDPVAHEPGTFRAEFVIAHSGREPAPQELSWVLQCGNETVEHGRCSASGGGATYGMGAAQAVLPEVERPTRLTLTVSAGQAANSCPLWVFPCATDRVIGVYDPAGELFDAQRVWTGCRPLAEDELPTAESPVVATRWHPHLASSRHRVVLLAQPGEHFRTRPASFWRECVALPTPHPLWGEVPLEDFETFSAAIGPRHVLEVPDGEYQPLLTRIDCRTGLRHEYAYALAPSLIVTTLAFTGGNGDQPTGLGRNIAGRYLLESLLLSIHDASA